MKINMSTGFLFGTLILCSSPINAAEIPKELHGKWTSESCAISTQAKKETGHWPGIVITKMRIDWDSQFCIIRKANQNKNRYSLDMRCTPLGDEDFNMTYTYDLSGDTVKESTPGGEWINSYKKCL